MSCFYYRNKIVANILHLSSNCLGKNEMRAKVGKLRQVFYYLLKLNLILSD